MFLLLLNSLKNRKFYTKGYKKVTRLKTFLFVVVISVVYSLVVTPVNCYFGHKDFQFFKSELNKIPQALNVTVKNGQLFANFTKPLEVYVNKSAVFVVDPSNKYNNYDEFKNYLIFKERGVVFINKGEMSNEQYGDTLAFSLTSKELVDSVNSISTYNIWIVLGVFYFISNALDIVFEVVLLSVIFGSFYFLLSVLTTKKHDTYFQNIKRVLFLSIYFCIGFLLNFVAGGNYPIIPFITFAIAYFLLIRKEIPKGN